MALRDTSSGSAAGEQNSSAGDPTLSVHAQTERLREAFGDTAADQGRLRRGANLAIAVLRGPRISRAAKVALGLALIAVCGVGPARRLFEDASIDAVANARLITLRAPIDGLVEQASFDLGARTTAGEMLLAIHNPLADRGRVDDLRRDLASAKVRRDGLNARLEALRRLTSKLTAQVDAFRKARRVQLQANLDDIKSQLAATEATKKQSDSNLQRVVTLTRSGSQTEAALERADRDATVAAEATRSMKQKLISVNAELQALENGYFVGDAYNDRPSSSQQADEVAIRIAETQAELAAAEMTVHTIEADLATEQRLQDARSIAKITAPAVGRIWELLVSPGEHVLRGEDLLRILDCSGGLVTGTVREAVYEKLSLGQAAQFYSDGGGNPYPGTIIFLSAGGTRAGNLAIPPSPNASYRVTVSVPALANPHCAVGRPGRLVFVPRGGHGVSDGSRSVAAVGLHALIQPLSTP